MKKQSKTKHELKTSLCSHRRCGKALQNDRGPGNLKDRGTPHQKEGGGVTVGGSTTFSPTCINPIIYQCV